MARFRTQGLRRCFTCIHAPWAQTHPLALRGVKFKFLPSQPDLELRFSPTCILSPKPVLRKPTLASQGAQSFIVSSKRNIADGQKPIGYIWLGWPDLNWRVRESKSRALPLGDIPLNLLVYYIKYPSLCQVLFIFTHQSFSILLNISLYFIMIRFFYWHFINNIV